MNNLIFSCADALPAVTTPACPTDYGERIVAILFAKEGTTITAVSSDYITAAEFQTEITATDIIIIKGITNGHKIKQGGTTLSGDDTLSGGEEEYDKIYRIEGRIRVFNESVKTACAKLDRFSTLKAWCITDKNYCYGGKLGYKASPNFDDPIHEGLGQPPYIAFRVDYTSVGVDLAHYDAAYATLV